MLLIPAQLLSEWYTCCCTRKQIRLTNSVCIYKCIPIFIQMYMHIRAPTWPSKHPCTPMHTHTYTRMTAHKTVLLTCGLHISEVMYRNHISLLYFVIRFFKVFNMVRGFFSHNSFQYIPRCKFYLAHVYLMLTNSFVCLHFKICLQLHQVCLWVPRPHSTDGKLEKLRHPVKPAFSKRVAGAEQ